MDKLKQWVALTVVGVIAILAAGWFLLVSPKRSDASDLDAQAQAKQAANAMLLTKLATLKAQAKDLPRQQAALAAVAAKIPDNPAMPALIRSLSKAAASAGVELVSIAPANVTPVVSTARTGAPVTPTVGSAPVATSSGTSAAPVTPSAGSAAGSAAGSSATAGTLSSISVTLSVVGGYFQVEQFLDGLESLQRAFKVGSISMAPGDNPVKPATGTSTGTSAAASGRSLTAAITGLVYLAPGRATAASVPTTAK